MATDIIARGMITEYIAGTNINFTENRDGTVEISASGSISSEDSVARDAINNHKSDTSNPHNVTPAQIGLGNVDNTSDLDKPISTAVQKAIDNKADKTVATKDTDGLMSAEDKGKLDSVDDIYALKSKYGDTTINVGRKAGTAGGIRSTAEGWNTTASGDYSHAGGLYTKALHHYEVAYGRYNVSNDDTLFSIGDGTDSARHNAFEITTTGGKLHDKDIATTDDLSPYAKKTDVPNIKVNEAVNADTVGGKSISDFIYPRGILSNVDLNDVVYPCSALILADCINMPTINLWGTLLCYDGGTGSIAQIFIPTAADGTPTNMWIRHFGGTGWTLWTEIYTSGNKPYVTGSATVEANSQICVTNHGFMPSAVIWWDSDGSNGVAVSFNETQFIINVLSTGERNINYMMFK